MRSIPKAPKMRPTTPTDGGSIKNPTYKGKTPARTVSGEADIQRPFPVGGKGGPKKTPAQGGGYGPGGRFGRGGWQASGQRMKKNFLARTPEQEAESEAKRRQMELKRKSAKTRISALKKGPNEKQSQLLGGE